MPIFYGEKVNSHACFKATYKLLSEQLASSPLVESNFLATFKLLCSIHVNVPKSYWDFYMEFLCMALLWRVNNFVWKFLFLLRIWNSKVSSFKEKKVMDYYWYSTENLYEFKYRLKNNHICFDTITFLTGTVSMKCHFSIKNIFCNVLISYN
jgi:hypothetical protein